MPVSRANELSLNRFAQPSIDLPSGTAPCRQQTTAADLGLNRLGRLFIALNAAVFIVDVLLFSVSHLTITWSALVLNIGLFGAFLVVWLNFYFVPGRPHERFAAEVILVVGLVILLTNFGSVMQYGAVALGFPFIDPWLAAADRGLGVYVPALASWTSQHQILKQLLVLAYVSFMPQFFFAVAVIAAYRDRERLWELAFHLFVCLIATVAALILFPAVCPPEYYHFQSSIDMTHLIRQIEAFHNGTEKLVQFDQLEGLVSFPSFHVAGALIVTWAFRRRYWLLVPLACVNLIMIASTFLTGVHYFVDALAGVALFGGSVALYRRFGRPLLEAERRSNEAGL
jgi:membrane-associated phospholipid phosphatase